MIMTINSSGNGDDDCDVDDDHNHDDQDLVDNDEHLRVLQHPSF